MFRFLSFVLLNFIFIVQFKYGLSQNNDTTTICDCNCDVQIDIVAKIMKDLEDVRRNTDNIGTKTSNIEKQLIVNRATKSSSCIEAAANSFKSGIYKIKLGKLNITEIEVFCEEDVDFGGWLVIQRRQSGSVNFIRDWQDYKAGFGDLTGNYWIGLEKLHALTSSCEQELYIQLEKFRSEKFYAKYSKFLIGSEAESYALKTLGNYSGNANDSLSYQLGYKFSTYDRDNDNSEDFNCAKYWCGGWWFGNCKKSNLNGLYNDYVLGMKWMDIRDDRLYTFAQMMIRPTENCLRRMILGNPNIWL